MHWFTVYDVRTSNDVAWDSILVAILAVLTCFGIGCAIALLRRPRGTRGRLALTTMVSGFSATLAGVALILAVAAANGRQQRADLVGGRYALLQGNVTAARRLPSGRRSDWAFELESHWFVAPNPACPQRPGDRVVLAYDRADDTHLGDIILRLQTDRKCTQNSSQYGRTLPYAPKLAGVGSFFRQRPSAA